MSTGLWQPSEAVAPEDGYLKRLNLADTAELLEYVRRDTQMPRKEYEQLTGLLTHARALEDEVNRLAGENAAMRRQLNRTSTELRKAEDRLSDEAWRYGTQQGEL